MTNIIVKWNPNTVQPETVIASLNSNNVLQMNSMSDNGQHWIKFYENGNIETQGSVTKATEYLINQCWELFFNLDKYYANVCTITIFNYVKIHLGERTITYAGDNVPTEFYKLKEVIEREVLRKLRLKAFW